MDPWCSPCEVHEVIDQKQEDDRSAPPDGKRGIVGALFVVMRIVDRPGLLGLAGERSSGFDSLRSSFSSL